MTMNYSKFMNELMAEVYNLFFQEILPRVFPEMKELLHLSPRKMVGDWFLVEAETIIRLYGFVYQPYVLPAFLTARIFSLEFSQTEAYSRRRTHPKLQEEFRYEISLGGRAICCKK